MNNISYSASLPPLPSPSLNRTANPPHHLATIVSDLATIPSYSTSYYSTITFQVFTILMRRHFNYLYFHTLAMTPTSITITDTTVRILVSRLPRSLSHLPDLGFFGAEGIMFLGRFLV